TQINLVAVHRENLFLRVVTLDLQREDRLLHLAMKAAVGAVEKQSAGKLHGESAGALRGAAAGDVAPGGLKHTRKIDAPVLLKVLVFGGDDRGAQDRRNLVVRQQNPALQGERADGLAVIGVELRFDNRAVGFERVNLGQVARIDEEQSAGGAERD